MEAPKVMTYVAASSDHTFMRNKILPLPTEAEPDLSITYKIFENLEEEGEVNYDTDKDEDGNEKNQFLYVDDVVREKKMHYFKIPKLGCYIACPLGYQDCLSEKYFKAALIERMKIEKKR